jgi:hypothetical protein
MVIAFAAAVALAQLAVASSDAQSAVLPSGVYRYAFYLEEKQTATSVITVTRSNGALLITESTTAQDEPATTIRTLDPVTFTTRRYELVTKGPAATADVTATNATYRQGGDKPPTTVAAKVGGPAIIFDFFAGAFIGLPAMVHGMHGSEFNAYCDCFTGFDVKPATIVRTPAPRPPNVPATDAVAAFNLDDAVATVWYEPTTFVLRELDVPKPKLKIILQEPT